MLNKVVFRSHSKVIHQLIGQALTSIDIAMCWFSNPMLFSLILRMAKTGVHIRLILQYDQANFHPKGLPFFDLINAGGALFVYHKQGKLFHHKFCIIDSKLLITGSFNWTMTRNVDNLILTDQSDLVRAHRMEFDQLWQHTEPLLSMADVPPPATNFSALYEPVLWNRSDLRHAIIWGGRVWLSVYPQNEIDIWEDCLYAQKHFLSCSADYFTQAKGIWEKESFKKWCASLTLNKQRLLKTYCLRAKVDDVIVTVDDKGNLLGAGLIGHTPEAGCSRRYAFARYVQWFEFSEGEQLTGRIPGSVFSLYRGSGLALINGLFERKAA